jgi:alcohol dehydrogenase class IV
MGRQRVLSADFGVLRLPDHILFGSGSLDSLVGVTQSFGRRVLICVDPFIATTELFLDAEARLNQAGLLVQLMTEIVPELPVASVESAAVIAREFRPDVIIGFGGGSAIDLAKLVALLSTYPQPLATFYGENAVPGPVLPLIAVPTTAGTGSEVTPVAVVSDPTRELKVGVSSPRLIPRYAIVDARLSLGAPPGVTAYSGIDAFVHAVECFTASVGMPCWRDRLPVFVGRNLFGSLLALEAIRVIGHNLRAAVSDSQDLAAHEAMAYGSLLAGMAFGSGGTHWSHALQYPIGALSKTPHGLGTGLMLPYVLQACLPEIGDELAQIADALDVGEGSPEARAESAIEAVRSLARDIGIPVTLAEIGIERDQLPRIAELALTVSRLAGNAPLPASQAEFERILEAAWSGDLAGLPR